MYRDFLNKYIKELYGVVAEFPWVSQPSYAVYRHKNNNKWFAVIMQLTKNKIGLEDNGFVNVVNLKCEPQLIGSLILEVGIHKGYHMNKNYWITVCLDGSVDEDKIKWLLDMSFDLTATKLKNNKVRK